MATKRKSPAPKKKPVNVAAAGGGSKVKLPSRKRPSNVKRSPNGRFA